MRVAGDELGVDEHFGVCLDEEMGMMELMV